MIFRIPIFVSSRKQRGQTVITARPLFFPHPVVSSDSLARLQGKLVRALGEQLAELGKQSRHDELARWTFHPTLTTERADLALWLGERFAWGRYFFVSFRHHGQRFAFAPTLPSLWFEVGRGQSIESRATEVFTEHFRRLAREAASDEVGPHVPEFYAVEGRTEIITLELDVRPPTVPPAPQVSLFQMLGGTRVGDGATELRRVGHCLDWLYPDELDRALLRDPLAEELDRLLEAPDRRPVLLVGPRSVGKSTLVQEVVHRRVARRTSAFRDRGNIWHLSPQRLVSGMSYVGQWEERLLAIVKEARKRQHLLLFDDLPGLFRAGQSASSSLSMAVVLKPLLERRELRLLAEITPEGLRVLRELDRGFADLFHILPVPEPSADATLRILLGLRRRWEERHRCCFSIDALPAALDLARRYGRDEAFPGKVVRLLQPLATRGGTTVIKRDTVLTAFHEQSGLSLRFLEADAKLPRDEILRWFKGRLVAQTQAVDALVDAISVARARLNDPTRPLAALMFLGPTGVGKTQAAKAAAAYLFGSADRLLRFDMNEYVDAGSAARLVGTLADPEGLLTSAVRRQPFAVVLLDEIEKAHPEVFDLLLQVLGEGRLTDALGRTADFTSTMVILTSNLGVREAERHFGLAPTAASGGRQPPVSAASGGRQPPVSLPQKNPGTHIPGSPSPGEPAHSAYVRAAERFFRPEFFNRLDRIIPFRRLERDEIRRIAQRLMGELVGREGFRQRRCVLRVEPRALEQIVDAGFDPLLGARALKRAIERHLTQPVAELLAAHRADDLTVISAYPGPSRLAVEVTAVLPVPRSIHASTHQRLEMLDVDELRSATREACRRIAESVARLRPSGALARADYRPEHFHYYAVQEQIEHVRDLAERLIDPNSGPGRRPAYTTTGRPGEPTRFRLLRNITGSQPGRGYRREVTAGFAIEEYLDDGMGASDRPSEGEAVAAPELIAQVALLELMASASGPRVLVVVRAGQEGGGGWWLAAFRNAYQGLRETPLGLETNEVPSRDLPDAVRLFAEAVVVQGGHALALLGRETGSHMIQPARGAVVPLAVEVLPLPDDAEPAAVLAEWSRRRERWAADLAIGRGRTSDDPWRPGPAVRLYEAQEPQGQNELTGRISDCRTGQSATVLTSSALSGWLLGDLAVPMELAALVEDEMT